MSREMDRLVASIARQTGTPVSLLAPPREFGKPERFVLWGGRVGRDAWVGSVWDRIEQARLERVERWRRLNRQITVTMRAMTGAFAEAMKQTSRQLEYLGKAIREGGMAPPEV